MDDAHAPEIVSGQLNVIKNISESQVPAVGPLKGSAK